VKALFLTEKVFELGRTHGTMPRRYRRPEASTVTFAKAAMPGACDNPTGDGAPLQVCSPGHTSPVPRYDPQVIPSRGERPPGPRYDPQVIPVCSVDHTGMIPRSYITSSNVERESVSQHSLSLDERASASDRPFVRSEGANVRPPASGAPGCGPSGASGPPPEPTAAAPPPHATTPAPDPYAEAHRDYRAPRPPAVKLTPEQLRAQILAMKAAREKDAPPDPPPAPADGVAS
jgi:hypothetical protein